MYAAVMAARNSNNTNAKSTGRKFMKSLNKHGTREDEGVRQSRAGQGKRVHTVHIHVRRYKYEPV